MAGWFAKLMQESHARSRDAAAAAGSAARDGVAPEPAARDARYDAVVRTLRERAPHDRAAREQRQRGYRQSLESDASAAIGASGPAQPARLHRFRTRVPCRMSPEARALLDQLKRQFPRGTVSFQPLAGGRQAVMLTRGPGAEPRQVGWIEHSVQSDPALCNVRHQGLAVETDGGAMLVLRFRYPQTAVRVSSHATDGATDVAASVDFAELRPALPLRRADRPATPRLVWVTRREADTLAALGSRDYEAFYVRFKREVLAGVWGSLSGLLASVPASRWHRGSHYSVVREPDPDRGRIYVRTVDDGGRAVDVGANRVHDAAAATDILLLHLDEDLLADVADIYFTLRGGGSADAYFLKEELFAVVRRFWAGSQSLVSRFGSEHAAVVRMSQRAMPMPAQASLLRQDWMNLRQSLVDRYGEGGCKAASLAAGRRRRARTSATTWPFATFAAGDVNVGLRIVYRQQWRDLGPQRGEVLRTVPASARAPELESAVATPGTTIERIGGALRSVETSIRPGDGTRSIDAIVRAAVDATAAALKWPRDLRGSIDTGVRGLAAIADAALEAECRESIRDGGARVVDAVLRATSAGRDRETPSGDDATDGERAEEDDAVARVHSRLDARYEVVTRAAELQNVVLVAERLPAPAEVDRAWVARHDWILSKVLLDESFRDALDTIGRDADATDAELHAKRERLYEHLRTSILHYQRAIWQHEDPQQRCMRYRKLGRKVPLDWRFELEAGDGLTIDELGARLAAANVDGQFAAYAGGREADLDQVIDPAGLVGHYGNYAVYQMRPELGSADAFAMLHFFKSAHLHPDSRTGAPDVGAPAPLAAARHVVLHTDGVVVDVVRDASAQAGDGAQSQAVHPGAAPAGGELVLEGARGIALLRSGGRRDTEAAWTAAGAVASSPLHAGVVAGSMRGSDAEVKPMIRHETREATGLQAGHAHGPESGPAIVASVATGADDTRVRALLAGARQAQLNLLATVDDDGARLLARPAEPPAGAPTPAITTRDGDTAVLHAGRIPALDVPVAIVGRGDAERAPLLHAGAGAPPTPDRAITPRVDAKATIVATVGGGAAPVPERPLLATHAAAGVFDLLATARRTVGHAHDAGAEPAIRMRGDGAKAPRLSAGHAKDAPAERMIRAREGGVPRLTVIDGGGAAHVNERAILAKGDGWLRPTLVAG